MLSFGMPIGFQHLCGGGTKTRTAKKQNSKMRKLAAKKPSAGEPDDSHGSTRRDAPRLFASMIRLAGEVLRSDLTAKLLIFYFLPKASAVTYESYEFLREKLGCPLFRQLLEWSMSSASTRPPKPQRNRKKLIQIRKSRFSISGRRSPNWR